MGNRAVAIIIRDNEVLLIHRIKDGREYFVFPGGGVEEGETAKQAVIREIKEDLGLDIKILREVFDIENQGRREMYFLVEKFSGEPKLGGEEKKRMNADNQYHLVWSNLEKAFSLPNLYPKQAREKIKTL